MKGQPGVQGNPGPKGQLGEQGLKGFPGVPGAAWHDCNVTVVDLAFLLDSSGSLVGNFWQAVLNFTAAVVRTADVSPDKTRFVCLKRIYLFIHIALSMIFFGGNSGMGAVR